MLPIKQQQKWCDALQILPNNINWNKIYENNYFATNETNLRSFQIRLNLRSIVTSGVKSILKLYLSKSTVTDGKTTRSKVESIDQKQHLSKSKKAVI